MKKILMTLCILIVIFYLRHVPSALLLPSIDGIKCYSLFVKSGSSNGYEYYLFNYPLFTIVTGDDNAWRICSTLDKNIVNIIANITDWPKEGPYYVASKATPNGYFTYIKTDEKVLYIAGFADHGGATPSEAEKKVCWQ